MKVLIGSILSEIQVFPSLHFFSLHVFMYRRYVKTTWETYAYMVSNIRMDLKETG